MKIMTLIYVLIDFLTKTDEKTIIFASYSGRQYSDSPRVIYEAIKNDEYFNDYKFVWAFRKPDTFSEVDPEEKVDINSFKFLKELFKAKYWISNASIERLIPTKHKKHVYINTWHGVPLKHLGPDEDNLEYIVKNWFKNVHFDLLTATNEFDKKIFKHIFPKNEETISVIGLPRNNELLVYNGEKDSLIKEKLNLTLSNKKIILYAPTFREYLKNKTPDFPFSKEQLEKLSYNYIILNRGHYFAENEDNDLVVNVSHYSNLNELMEISDLLITDYSSIMFDYELLQKPILLLADDLEEYSKKRGIYMPLEELGFSIYKNKTSLFDQLMSKEIPTNKNRRNVQSSNNIEIIRGFLING